MGNYIMYLRKSRSDRDYGEESIELTLSRHRERLNELCEKMGISCDTVLQEVVSGDSIAGRPEMIKLLQMVESGAYEGVVCIDMDRLSRGSGADQALVINTFKYSDTKIITPAKTYDFALETDEQFAELSLFMAKQEYRQIKKRLYQGRIDSVKEGKWPAQKAPYGYESYKLKGQKGLSLRIIPEEAEVVRMIFRMYLEENIGSKALAHKLNEMGFKARENEWTPRTIYLVLANPVYTGKVRFGQHKSIVQVENGEVTHKKMINKDPLIADGLHEPIISKEDFDHVQEILQRKAKVPIHVRGKLLNPFSKILRCGYCGGRYGLYNKRCKDGGKLIRCYTTGCKGRPVRVDIVESRVLDVLNNYLDDLEFGTDPNSSGAALAKSMESLRKKLDSLHTKLERQTAAYEDGVFELEQYRTRSEQTKSEINVVVEQLESIKAQLGKRNEIAPKIRNIVDHYYELGDEGKRNLYLKEILDRIEIKKDTRSRDYPDDFELTIYPKTQ